jgi:hypothetical protein
MLNGKPFGVSTFFRLKEIKFLPDFSEPSGERWLPARMQAEIEVIPFGFEKPGTNPTITATVNVPEHMRKILEEAIDNELRDFVHFTNRERGPRKLVSVIPKGPEGHGGQSRIMSEETAYEVERMLREIHGLDYEIKVEDVKEGDRADTEDDR